MSAASPDRIPAHLRPRVDEIVALTTAFATAHLDTEYAALCRRMAVALARRRPSPLERGDARPWAAGIVHAVGWVNFLGDPSQRPHLTTAELAARAGVAQGTVADRSRRIREALDLRRLDPAWTRPSHLLDNPVAWMIIVDGLLVDAREAPRALQEEAFRLGLIPFVPAAQRADEAGASSARSALDEAEELLTTVLAEHPDATDDELEAAVAAALGDHNVRPQAVLGGLSPAAVRRLLDADWESERSAIRLSEAIPRAELAGSRTLHDARVVLALLGERGTVRATPKGNLPRDVVAAAWERMRPAAAPDEWSTGHRVRGEEDVFPLHVARILLELGGLVKCRKGTFSLTRRGERLADGDRAGALLATLVRTHFRRLDLAYLDGIGPAPGFQYAIGYTLYRFGQVGATWRTPAELADELVLPAVRAELPSVRGLDVLALIVETRLLRPLEGLGLAESEAEPGEHGVAGPRRRYRKTGLFDRVVGFEVEGEGTL